MPTKKQSATTIRIDLLPDLHEQLTQKKQAAPIPHPHPSAQPSPSTPGRNHKWGPDFQELFQSVYDAAFITRPDGQILDANERAMRFSDFTLEELVSFNILDLISCSDSNLLQTILNILHEEKFVLIEAYTRRKDDTVFPSEISVNQINLSGSLYLCFFIRDTSQRENAEQLRRQMHYIINRSHAVAFRFTTDAAMTMTYVSDSLQQYGFDAEAFMKERRSLLDLIHPDDANDCLTAVRNQAAQGAEEVELECRLLTDGSETRWIHLQGWFVRGDDGQALYCQGVFMDISEHKHIEEERALMEIRLRQAQKLESMGQLAAGIAHEINSPTQFVGDSLHFLQTSYADICRLLDQDQKLLDQCRELPPVRELAHSIRELRRQMDYDFLIEEIPRAMDRSLKGIKRIADIVLAMKEFSHPGSSERSLVDINKTIENAIIVAKNEWKYVAEMETELDDTLPMIRCIPGEINQVILNILVNAAQAIAEVQGHNAAEKGRITIITRRDHDHALIEIKDTGIGIPDEIKSRIYDPFFTTKEVGKGTGQGLTIAYNIVVNRHGGKLTFESVHGRGTTFRILLPTDSHPPDAPLESPLPPPAFSEPLQESPAS